jgi:two-component system sensor histidine kinase/response regulator
MNPEMYRDILLEIAVAASGELDHEKLFQACLPIFLRKLNCTLAAVIRKEDEAWQTVHLLPRAMARNPVYRHVSRRLQLALETPASQPWRCLAHENFLYYAFPLEDYGFLLLARSRPLDTFFLHEMIPLSRILTKACLSCLETEKRRQSEAELLVQKAHFESIFTNTLDAMAYFDVQHRILIINSRFTEMFGYTQEEVAGRDINSIVDPLRIQKEYGSPRILRGETLEMEAIRYGKDGRIIEVLLKGGPVYVNGEIRGGYVIYSDISQRKNHERQLQESNLLLEKAIAQAKAMAGQAEMATMAKSTFLATMSHEIRTPLNVIIGLTDLCLSTSLSERQRDYLTKVAQAGHSLLGVINDILDFSRIEAGKLRMEKIPFSLEEVFRKISDLFSHKAREKGLRLRWSKGKEVPEDLVGDPLRLAQILTNLVGNAIKFTEKGKVEIHTRALVLEEKSAVLEFQVRDTGIGMAEKQIPGLFQPFSQADSSTTRRFGGSGLGLAISRELVELMQGEIRMKSQPGKGSICTFTCRLARGLPSPPEHRVRPLPPSALIPLHGKRILLVEDHAVNRQLGREILKQAKVQVDMAENGMEALKKIQEQAPGHYHLVLMDVQMPIMDGYEATRRIRRDARFQNLPILAMTANAMAEDRQRALACGMDNHIAKPIDPRQLFSLLLHHLAVPSEEEPPGAAAERLSGKHSEIIDFHG